MNRYLRLASLLVLAALPGAPLAAQTAAAKPTLDQSPPQASESYVIEPLDLLRFRVVGEDETATEVRVANDGNVNLPYIGNVKVAHMSVADARKAIYALYNKDYYVDPQIDMAIIGYRERKVNVQGMVNNQGFVVFPPEQDMTLLGAISAAGGWRQDRLSDPSNVDLTRTLADGTSKTYHIDTTKITPNDWVLQDGDFIVVHERRW